MGNARLLLGDSLAGSIALMTALTYSTIFSQAAILSPMYDKNIKLKLENCNNKEQLTLWHAIGLRRGGFHFAY